LTPFREELRGEIFERYRDLASPGDWWCRLDADEFYVDDPREFLRSVDKRFGFVRSATYNVYFTDADVAAYEADPAGWLARPVQDRLRHYQNNWSEGRFVRHRANLRWEGHIWPENRGRTCRDRIRLLHYQYRSPDQIAHRLEIRQQNPECFPHESSRALLVPRAASTGWASDALRDAGTGIATWKDRVRPAGECDVADDSGTYVAHPELMPPLPSPWVDGVRATLQASTLGSRLVAPLLARRRRRLRGGR
jgi:hypothetical protein